MNWNWNNIFAALGTVVVFIVEGSLLVVGPLIWMYHLAQAEQFGWLAVVALLWTATLFLIVSGIRRGPIRSRRPLPHPRKVKLRWVPQLFLAFFFLEFIVLAAAVILVAGVGAGPIEVFGLAVAAVGALVLTWSVGRTL